MGIRNNIESFDNLYKGLKDSCRNVRWKSSVVSYELHGLRNTYNLRRDLVNGKYKIQPYQHFTIHEPKRREITATRIRDRQFQHSMVDNYAYGQLTKSFIHDNCACLRGRGVDYCLDRMTRHLRKYYLEHRNDGYALKCDIHHFFQSIPHSVAKAAIRKRISDDFTVEHICEIIDSFDGDNGIGLGSQVSQLVALAVLDDLDHFTKEKLRIKYYIRYMDDFVLIHNDKDYLKYCRSEIEKQLNSIGLELNRKTGILKLSQGVKLLQWRFVLCNSGRILKRMDKKKISKQRRRIKKLYAKELKGEVPQGTCNQSMQSYMANARRGDSFYVRKKVAAYYYEMSGVKYHGYVKCRNEACAARGDSPEQRNKTERQHRKG